MVSYFLGCKGNDVFSNMKIFFAIPFPTFATWN